MARFTNMKNKTQMTLIRKKKTIKGKKNKVILDEGTKILIFRDYIQTRAGLRVVCLVKGTL